MWPRQVAAYSNQPLALPTSRSRRRQHACLLLYKDLPAADLERWKDCKFDCSTWTVLYPEIFELEAEIIKKGDDTSTRSTS